MIYVKDIVLPAAYLSGMSETEFDLDIDTERDDLHEVARAMIRGFGSDAPAILRMRVDNHRRHGALADAEYWHRVGALVARILRGSQARDGDVPYRGSFETRLH
jgi:hypothetical protein